MADLAYSECERELATIDTILSVTPIDRATSIELVMVRGWQCVARIGEFRVGDRCVYFEIDSLLPDDLLPPDTPVAQIMKAAKYRVKTKRMLGHLSQGLALPLSMFPMIDDSCLTTKQMDVTKLLGVTKYEPPQRSGSNVLNMGPFPEPCIKTACSRIQNLRAEIEGSEEKNEGSEEKNVEGKDGGQDGGQDEGQDGGKREKTDYVPLSTISWTITEKIDGCSATFGYIDGKLIACSRNFRVDDSDDKANYWWRVVRKYDLETCLKAYPGLILQGEIIEPTLQKNRYRVQDVEFHVFRCHDISKGFFLGWANLIDLCGTIGLPVVPQLECEVKLNVRSMKEWLLYADGKSMLNRKSIREGVVLSPSEDTVTANYRTIKVISNEYLLKSK